MRALTTDELADILLQTPNRITAGILDDRSLVERCQDKVFQHDDKRVFRHADRDRGPLEKLGRKLFIYFEAGSKVKTEHPRSLKRAIFELKALGFTHRQIEQIKSCCYGFAQARVTPETPLGKALLKGHPDYGYDWCDDAFLGAAAVQTKGFDSQTISNTLYAPAREKQVWEEFHEHVAEYATAGFLKTSILMPEAPRKRYARLCP